MVLNRYFYDSDTYIRYHPVFFFSADTKISSTIFLAVFEQLLSIVTSFCIVALKKAGGKTPRVELEEIGPSVDFKLRRTKLASDDLFKLACKRPKSLKVKKVKNVTHDAFGTKLGRIHMTRQDVNKLQTRKMKGLKKSIAEKKQEKSQRVVNNGGEKL
ncbi:rRNA-binding ribosome biosynthesis protein rpf2 [Homalodisca vitripennis]|nr:rRNA-binding ribosome biosynthesis protein rpf2 [Homalodisca vitripennis]